MDYFAMAILTLVAVMGMVGLVVKLRQSIIGPSDEEYLDSLQKKLDNQVHDSCIRYLNWITGVFLFSTVTCFILTFYPYIDVYGYDKVIISSRLDTSLILGFLYGIVVGTPAAYYINKRINYKLAEKRISFKEELKNRSQKKSELKIA